MPEVRITRRGDALAAAQFQAMACPCEVLVATPSIDVAKRIGQLVADEAWRIERKYSRYREDSITTALNRSAGAPVPIDEETRGLLQFAAQCHRLSGGAFDITSGVLRRAWKFDGSGTIPSTELIQELRTRIGFEKLEFTEASVAVPSGMELDFGGIGKEYAVDRALSLAVTGFDGAVLVNFGGDLAANRPPADAPWKVGVERPDTDGEARLLLDFERGGLATSGDTHRRFEHDGVRYSHILDVRTGWPVRDAPRSVTVAAASCVEAGLLATLAMLHGAQAQAFLDSQGATCWCLW